uniref:Uncharacterized protein n=1 Tax=Tanacetum cinerariifolium TaxID=118510 RepID=A0A6L2J6T0_TANCI|nr:hypothetical protein [Tanacetum cinerariifolium]
MTSFPVISRIMLMVRFCMPTNTLMKMFISMCIMLYSYPLMIFLLERHPHAISSYRMCVSPTELSANLKAISSEDISQDNGDDELGTKSGGTTDFTWVMLNKDHGNHPNERAEAA